MYNKNCIISSTKKIYIHYMYYIVQCLCSQNVVMTLARHTFQRMYEFLYEYMHVWMNAFMYLCMKNVCMYVWINVRMYKWMHLCMYEYINAFMYVLNVWIHVCKQKNAIYAYHIMDTPFVNMCSITTTICLLNHLLNVPGLQVHRPSGWT